MSRVCEQFDVPSVRTGSTQIVPGNSLVHLRVLEGANRGAFTWRQISGPPVELRGADTSEPSFRAPEHVTNTQLCFEVHVTLGTETAKDSCVVVVNPDHGEPVNDAGSNQTVAMGEIVRLHGSCTSPGGGMLHRWVQTGGRTVSLLSEFDLHTEFEAPFEVGTLRFELTTISATAVTVDTVDVEVTEPYLT